MMSLMPRTPSCSTLSATLKASVMGIADVMAAQVWAPTGPRVIGIHCRS